MKQLRSNFVSVYILRLFYLNQISGFSICVRWVM